MLFWWCAYSAGQSEHGNLVDVIKSKDDLGCLLHANEVIQYRDGINVPHKKNTVR